MSFPSSCRIHPTAVISPDAQLGEQVEVGALAVIDGPVTIGAGTIIRPGAYLYGPICVAESERGRGLAARLFTALRKELRGREGILFIRRDNAASLGAHAKMGMREVAEFHHGGIAHVVLSYVG